MRVVMVSKALVRGAYQRKLEELAGLPGVELTLVTPPAWRDGGQRLELERLYTRGYELVVAPIRFTGRFHVYHYPGLGGLLARLRPDVVHADEEPYNLATLQAIWEARRLGARTLFFTWQNILRRLPPPFSLVERYVLGRADAAIAGNRAAAVVLRQKGYRGPLEVIPQFGVDPELFRPSTEGPPAEPAAPRPFTVGYLGRLVRSKGVLDLLAAAAGLPGDWRLELVGSGPLRGELAARAAALGLLQGTGRLRLREEVPSTEVPGVLAGFDVLALPSRTTPSWKEQFGRVLVEAMACEVPVVGSDSGEIPHVVGEAGLVFPEGDVAALRDCLARLAADAAERRRLGRLGRARVLAHYTQAQVAAATHRLYTELSDGRQV